MTVLEIELSHWVTIQRHSNKSEAGVERCLSIVIVTALKLSSCFMLVTHKTFWPETRASETSDNLFFPGHRLFPKSCFPFGEIPNRQFVTENELIGFEVFQLRGKN